MVTARVSADPIQSVDALDAFRVVLCAGQRTGLLGYAILLRYWGEPKDDVRPRIHLLSD